VSDQGVLLLGTRGCHLCEDAAVLLGTASRATGVPWTYVDIADDDALLELYAERIPVLRHLNGEIGWPFGLLDVLRLMRGESN